MIHSYRRVISERVRDQLGIIKRYRNGSFTSLYFLATGTVNRYVNHQVDSGATAVYLACQEGHLDIVQHLVDEAGASLKLRCYDGMSCLHAVTLSGQQELLQWLVRPSSASAIYMLLL